MSAYNVEVRLVFSSDEPLNEQELDFLGQALETDGVGHLRREGLLTPDDCEAIVLLNEVNVSTSESTLPSRSLLEHFNNPEAQALENSEVDDISELSSVNHDNSLWDFPSVVSELTDEVKAKQAIAALKAAGLTEYASNLESVIEHSIRHTVYQDNQ